MSLYTHTSFSIGEHQFTSFHSLTLNQTISGHHEFEIMIGYDWLTRLGKGLFNAGKEFLGKEISISVNPVETHAVYKPLIFNGIVDGISVGKESDGTHGFCVIKGHSVTILLEDDENIATFEDKNLSAIISEALKGCGPYGKSPAVDPSYTESLKYIVQYKETTYQFISRLAARFGEWFFFDGEKVVFGNYRPQKISLTHQVDLVDFHIDLTVKSNNSRLYGFDYRQYQTVNHETAAVAAGNLDVYTNHLKEVSEKLYKKTSANRINQWMDNAAKAQLDKYTTVQKKGRLARMALLKGASQQTGLRIGDIITVNESVLSSEHHGEFVVTSLVHHCTENGLYRNTFEAIPAAAAMPEVDLHRIPVCEPQSAVVTDNNDPEGLGRVRVRFQWQEQGTTPWVRIVSPHGGPEKGFYFIPENGEEVWVDFEGGNAEAPLVMGTVYNGSAKTSFGDAQNNHKVIKTRSGHIIRLDDTDGAESITITDKSGNIVTLDTNGKNINISAPENVTINARNISFTAAENIQVNAGKNLTQAAVKDFSLMAANIREVADDTLQRTAKTIEKTAEKVSMNSTKENIEMHSAKQIVNKSGDKAKLF
ncbi:type VI secretion system tip protein VgrG [Chitinophaga sp. 212800010-3]|uniref:type VI secretion system Vgr family protein n=1 Tax=unclassified Chitinophaga TaxID=2619133 RepID=UPI002DE69339|nr:Phage-base-V domain-containing protein [Chitinophaga sp. 212800010-3]